MLPKTHQMLIEEGARGIPWAERNLRNLLRGNDDEDVLIVPWIGWRLPAAGLSHTTRPGRRSGELGAISSTRKADTLWRARRCAPLGEGCLCARSAGRVAHLLIDAAVPARARGVWHLTGDPLELWLEAHLLETKRAIPCTLRAPSAPTAGALVHALASDAAWLRADTTRTPWGKWAFEHVGWGARLEPHEVKAQGQVLVGWVVGYMRARLRLAEAECEGRSSSSGSIGGVWH